MISTKPTIYLIDGLNFVRSFLDSSGENEEEEIKRFLMSLEEAAQSPIFSKCEFRVFFDGGYRNVGKLSKKNLITIFTNELKADDLILEQAVYLKSVNKRTAVVTSDRNLMQSSVKEGIKTFNCQKFYRMYEKAFEIDF